MNKERPDPKDVFMLAKLINDQRPISDQQTIEVGKAMMKTAGLIDRCAICISVRHDRQPGFVDLITNHFKEEHIVNE